MHPNKIQQRFQPFTKPTEKAGRREPPDTSFHVPRRRTELFHQERIQNSEATDYSSCTIVNLRTCCKTKRLQMWLEVAGKVDQEIPSESE